MSCHVSASCTDNEGSYDWQCNIGILEMDLIVLLNKSLIVASKVLYLSANHILFLISIIFVDVDECSSKPCHHNATCTDNEGSFDCECNVGYSGNEFNCSSK
jgi:hypothetical protein